MFTTTGHNETLHFLEGHEVRHTRDNAVVDWVRQGSYPNGNRVIPMRANINLLQGFKDQRFVYTIIAIHDPDESQQDRELVIYSGAVRGTMIDRLVIRVFPVADVFQVTEDLTLEPSRDGGSLP